jgi:hypothetical protein
MADFLQLYLDQEHWSTTTGGPLEVTRDHLLLASNGKMVPAGSIQVGDALESVQGPSKVIRIDSIQRSGFYAPLTPSGTVAVNGVVASNYVVLQKKGSEYLTLQGGFVTPVSQHLMIHLFLSPLRVACLGIYSGFCSNGVDTDMAEFPGIVSFGLKLFEWLEEQHILVQLILYTMFLIVWGLSYTMECILGAPLLCVASLLAGVMVFFRSFNTRATVHKNKMKTA